MRIVKPNFEIWEQSAGLKGVYKQIERAGRVSHKSEDRITEDSAKTFVDRMINMNHLATCEFGTVYLKVPTGKYQFLDNDYFDECDDIKDSFYSNPYTKIHCQEGYHYISTNYRVLLENFSKEFISELLQYLCEPTKYHHKRYTVKFICDRGILAEFTRHRKFSFMAESTRYCNYSKGKFNNELTFIIPCWMDIPEGNIDLGDYDKTSARYDDGNIYSIDTKPPYVGVDFIRSLCEVEASYLNIVRNGWKAEQARSILPLCLKTELYMCGFAEDWEKFFELRCAANAHPQARELAIPLKEEFIKRNYI